MTIDKDKLRALAEAATPGPWSYNGNCRYGVWSAALGCYVFDCGSTVDADFTAAANPATILSLLGEIERLELIGQLAYNQDGYRAVLDERDQLKSERDTLQAQVAALQAEPQSWQSGYDAGRKSMAGHADSWRKEAAQVKAESEALRNALNDCATSLEGEMLQKFGGQKPEDMHPVTRREYDRDMEELAGYRSAMSAGVRT